LELLAEHGTLYPTAKEPNNRIVACELCFRRLESHSFLWEGGVLHLGSIRHDLGFELPRGNSLPGNGGGFEVSVVPVSARGREMLVKVAST
jgi:hypothetical protein